MAFTNITNSEHNSAIQKAFGIDISKGGKKANIGEIRDWNGKKYKKQANGKWLEISFGPKQGNHNMTKKEHEEESKKPNFSHVSKTHKNLASQLSDKEHSDEEVGIESKKKDETVATLVHAPDGSETSIHFNGKTEVVELTDDDADDMDLFYNKIHKKLKKMGAKHVLDEERGSKPIELKKYFEEVGIKDDDSKSSEEKDNPDSPSGRDIASLISEDFSDAQLYKMSSKKKNNLIDGYIEDYANDASLKQKNEIKKYLQDYLNQED